MSQFILSTTDLSDLSTETEAFTKTTLPQTLNSALTGSVTLAFLSDAVQATATAGEPTVTYGDAVSADLANGTALAVGESAGVYRVAGWNNPTGFSNFAATNLNDQTSSATTLDLTATGFIGNNTTRAVDDGETDFHMFARGLAVPLEIGTPANLVIAEIPYSTYDVFVYFDELPASVSGRQLTISDGTTPSVITATGASRYAGQTYTEGSDGNYVVFSGLTSASTTIVISSNSTFSADFAIVGMQVVESLQTFDYAVQPSGAVSDYSEDETNIYFTYADATYPEMDGSYTVAKADLASGYPVFARDPTVSESGGVWTPTPGLKLWPAGQTPVSLSGFYAPSGSALSSGLAAYTETAVDALMGFSFTEQVFTNKSVADDFEVSVTVTARAAAPYTEGAVTTDGTVSLQSPSSLTTDTPQHLITVASFTMGTFGADFRMLTSFNGGQGLRAPNNDSTLAWSLTSSAYTASEITLTAGTRYHVAVRAASATKRMAIWSAAAGWVDFTSGTSDAGVLTLATGQYAVGTSTSGTTNRPFIGDIYRVAMYWGDDLPDPTDADVKNLIADGAALRHPGILAASGLTGIVFDGAEGATAWNAGLNGLTKSGAGSFT